MTPHYIYVIKSEKDGRLYKGLSEEPDRRLLSHNSGRVNSTKGYTPWKLFILNVILLLKKLEPENYFKNQVRGGTF